MDVFQLVTAAFVTVLPIATDAEIAASDALAEPQENQLRFLSSRLISYLSYAQQTLVANA